MEGVDTPKCKLCDDRFDPLLSQNEDFCGEFCGKVHSSIYNSMANEFDREVAQVQANLALLYNRYHNK